jgi:hypothetical protein
MSIAFGIMLKTPLVILSVVPNVIFKPFAMWVVNGYIDDLLNAENAESIERRNMYRNQVGPGAAGDMGHDDYDSESEPEEFLDDSTNSGGRSRKKTTAFVLKDDSTGEVEESDPEVLERRALILKSASSQ